MKLTSIPVPVADQQHPSFNDVVVPRREALISLAAGGICALAPSLARGQVAQRTSGASLCVVRPQQTAGPFFIDRQLNRSDIRSDPASNTLSNGVPLSLTFMVSRISPPHDRSKEGSLPLGGKARSAKGAHTSASGCVPLPGAQVDVWQCDASGVYSAVDDGRADTQGQRFLRGYQVTDAAGRAQFMTIYPGAYAGRAVHIHFRIRTGGASAGEEFTSQLYFDDRLSDQVLAEPSYSTKPQSRTRNARDGLFRQNGEALLLEVIPGAGRFAATFAIALV